MKGIDIVAVGADNSKVVASYRVKDGVLAAVGGFSSILEEMAKGLPAADGSEKAVVPADGDKFIEAVKKRYQSASYMSVREIE